MEATVAEAVISETSPAESGSDNAAAIIDNMSPYKSEISGNMAGRTLEPQDVSRYVSAVTFGEASVAKSGLLAGTVADYQAAGLTTADLPHGEVLRQRDAQPPTEADWKSVNMMYHLQGEAILNPAGARCVELSHADDRFSKEAVLRTIINTLSKRPPNEAQQLALRSFNAIALEGISEKVIADLKAATSPVDVKGVVERDYKSLSKSKNPQAFLELYRKAMIAYRWMKLDSSRVVIGLRAPQGVDDITTSAFNAKNILSYLNSAPDFRVFAVTLAGSASTKVVRTSVNGADVYLNQSNTLNQVRQTLPNPNQAASVATRLNSV